MEEEIPSRKVVLRGALSPACAKWTPILPAERGAQAASDTRPAASAPSGTGAAGEPAQTTNARNGVST